MTTKTIRWGQPVKTNVVKPGEWAVPSKTTNPNAVRFIGPGLNNQIFPQGSAIGPYDFSTLFSGIVSTYSLVGLWPASVALDSVTGIMSGTWTDTEGDYIGLGVRATGPDNSATTNLIAVTITKSEGPAPPVFSALTYDRTTFEMQGLHTGFGKLTATHTSVLYAPDHLGIYQKYPANAPVWSGGRVVLSGGAGSDVASVFADSDGAGTLLPDLPYLQFYPAATNLAPASNDTTNTTYWRDQTNGGSVQRNQVGITGESNTALILNDTSSSVGYRNINVDIIEIESSVATLVAWIKKDSNTTRFPSIALLRDGQWTIPNINTQDGSFVFSDTGFNSRAEVISDGDWWKVMAEDSSPSSLISMQYQIEPARSDSSSGQGNVSVSATGSAIFGNIELHNNKTIEEVRGLGPIFTTTAVVATDVTLYTFDIANQANDSAWYMELEYTGNGTSEDNILTMALNNSRILYRRVAGNQFGGYNGATNPLQVHGTLLDTPKQYASVSHVSDNKWSVNVDGTYGTEVAFSGTTNGATISLPLSTILSTMKFRNLQRYDITSYNEGKSIIDGLMA